MQNKECVNVMGELSNINVDSMISLTSPTEVKSFLIDIGFHPSKVLGQNFLIDSNILDIIIETADICSDDIILEVGPGLGVVTERLLKKSKRVIAIEKDLRLAEILKKRWQNSSLFNLINTDVLQCDLSRILSSGVTGMVSNLPYSVGSRVLVEIASSPIMPERMVVTLQDEVARRLAADPGNKDFGLLTARMQLCYDVRIVKKVSCNCFWPPPKVESSIIELKRHSRYVLTPEITKMFQRLLKVAFAQRRKQIHGILGKQFRDIQILPADAPLILADAGIEPDLRPGDIAVEKWVRLAEICSGIKYK